MDNCTEDPCEEGEGDCDNDEECKDDLKCGINNCGSGHHPLADCCYKEEKGKKVCLR